MDTIVGDLHVSADLAESRACIIADFLLGENASADFCGQRCEWRKSIKHAVQRVTRKIVTFFTRVSFDSGSVFKKSADCQNFLNTKSTADFQTFQRTTDIFDISKRNGSFLE